MERRSRRRVTVGVFTSMFAILAIVPTLALGATDPVGDLLNGLLGGGSQGGTGSADSGGGASTPAAGTPPSYTPPAHGTGPHGEGSVTAVDLGPADTVPLGDHSSEEVIVGGSSGSEAGGSYHGQVTLVDENLLDLINVSIDTNEGETENGPAEPLNDALDQGCAAFGQPDGCIELLPMRSQTTASGSENSFAAAATDLSLDLGPLGELGLASRVASSDGDISENANCQTSTGESNVVDADGSVPIVGGLTADVLQSSSTSTACNNGTPPTQTNSSKVINLQAMGLPIPEAGCADGTPNSDFTALAPILSTVCNANDSNGSQAASPYGVREALTVFLLDVELPEQLAGPLGDLLPIKVATAGAESLAVAPDAPDTPGTPPTGNDDRGSAGETGGPRDDGEGGPGGTGEPGGPVTTTAQPGGDELAFTGANLLALALIGGALLAGGLMLASTARRHRRATA